jgi:hypothetical protein
MVMPFLIGRAINSNLLKETFINNVLISCELSRKKQVIDQLCYLWVLFAKLVALIFKKTYSELEIKSLNNYIIQWADMVSKVYY